jgi:hypothetical protein
MKKIVFTLLVTSLLNSSAHGMGKAWATRLASATKFARKHIPTLKAAPGFAHATAKPAQKSLIRATLKPQQSQSNFWDRLSKSFASAWQRVKQNFKLPEWIKSSAAQEQIKKVVKSYAHTAGTRAPLIGGAMAATAVKTAYAQGTDREMPACTADAIFNYRFSMQHRNAFIAHAVKNITAKDTETIEAITAMLEQYPQSHVPITQAAIAAFNDVQPVVLQNVLKHNAWAHDRFVKKLMTEDNPHLDELFKNYVVHIDGLTQFYDRVHRCYTTITHKTEYTWTIDNGDGTPRNITQAILERMIQDPTCCSIEVHNKIYKRLIAKNSFSLSTRIVISQLRASALNHWGQDAATLIGLASRTLKESDVNKPLCLYYSDNYHPTALVNFNELTDATMREIETLNAKDISLAYNYINGYSWYNYENKNKIKEAAQKRFGQHLDLNNLTLKDLVSLHSCMNGITTTIPSTFPYPYFLIGYNPEIYPRAEAIIRDRLLNNDDDAIASLSIDDMTYIRELIFKINANDDSRDQLKKALELGKFIQKVKKRCKDLMPPVYSTNIVHAVMQGYDQFPSFLASCTQDNHQTTQSEKHFCANMTNVMIHMFRDHSIKQKTNAIPMFKRALAKERQELAKGNHVFYHGRKWEYDFWADMDKMTYNLTHPDKPLTDIRLRFDDSDGALCLNYALFANATRKPSNTASYVVNNHDFSSALSRFNLGQFFQRFGQESHFNRYKKEFEKLREMHTACNKHGSLLMLSVPDKHLNDIVYSAEEGSMGRTQKARVVHGVPTTDMHTIINALKTDPSAIQHGNSDYIEFALRITPQLKDKVRIYPMSQADPAKYKEYTDYRDQLFAQIKTDIEKGKQ